LGRRFICKEELMRVLRLFVGGKADGQWLETDDLTVWRVPIFPQISITDTISSGLLTMATLEYDFYHLECISFPEGVRKYFYVHDGLSAVAAFDRLLSRYAAIDKAQDVAA
jgi:hypothetical protein